MASSSAPAAKEPSTAWHQNTV